MAEKSSLVRNPLTLISIFSGVTVAVANAVLPFITSRNQDIYIWFLIGYPAILVILFFVTLNFNRRALYSPSDFRDDKSFLAMISPGETMNFTSGRESIKGKRLYNSVSTDIPKTLEETALDRYAKERNMTFIRNAMINGRNAKFPVDGISITESEYRIVEVKKLAENAFEVVRHALFQLKNLYDQFDGKSRENFKVTLIGIIEDTYEIKESDKMLFHILSYSFEFQVDIVFYTNSYLVEKKAEQPNI